jgi:hypothetical protein
MPKDDHDDDHDDDDDEADGHDDINFIYINYWMAPDSL